MGLARSVSRVTYCAGMETGLPIFPILHDLCLVIGSCEQMLNSMVSVASELKGRATRWPCRDAPCTEYEGRPDQYHQRVKHE